MLRIVIESTDAETTTEYLVSPDKKDDLAEARAETTRLRDDLQRAVLQTNDLAEANKRLSEQNREAAERMGEMLKARGLAVGELARLIDQFFRARQAVCGEDVARALAEEIRSKMEVATQREEVSGT
jgi:hypothetical protein